jgi:hypothetical protein
MNLKSIASNQTELEKPNGVTVFYSYSTPVAAFVPGKGGLATTERYSKTTSKHVTQAFSRWGCSRVNVPQAEIDAIANA